MCTQAARAFEWARQADPTRLEVRCCRFRSRLAPLKVHALLSACHAMVRGMCAYKSMLGCRAVLQWITGWARMPGTCILALYGLHQPLELKKMGNTWAQGLGSIEPNGKSLPSPEGGCLQGLEGACARRWTWRTWRRGHCQGLRVSTSAPAMQGLEVYSTVLWHLRKEVDLAHLAQEALSGS